MIMNYDPITLYSRTKLGTFTLVPPKFVTSIPPMTSERINHVNTVQDHSGTKNDCNSDESRNRYIEEIFSKVNINKEHLSENETSQIKSLISEYIDIFQREGGPLGFYSNVKHEIRPESHPIRSRPYRYAPHVQTEIRRQVKQMLEQGVIRESTSPWSFPVCMIPKAGTNTCRSASEFSTSPY